MSGFQKTPERYIVQGIRPRSGRVRDASITMAHGGGGKAMRDLIEDVFLRTFDNSLLAPLEDQAIVPLAELAAYGNRLAFTTDTYVVDPLFFPGGDIGTLTSLAAWYLKRACHWKPSDASWPV